MNPFLPLLSKVARTDDKIGFFGWVLVIGIPYVRANERYPQPDIFSCFQTVRTYNYCVCVVLPEIFTCTSAISLTGSPLECRFNGAELFHCKLEIGRKGIRVGGDFIQVVTHRYSAAGCIRLRRWRLQSSKNLI